MVGVKIVLSYIFSAASAAGSVDHGVGFGLLVAPTTMDDVDMNPRVHLTLPWLDWGMADGNSGASVNIPMTSGPFVGDANSDGGMYHRARSKRKLDNLEETLWLSMTCTCPAGTWGYAYATSVVLALP